MKNNISITEQAERIINPISTLASVKRKLINSYKEDYGKKYKSSIISKLDNIIYIFDSLPTDTYTFINNNKNSLSDEEYFNIQKECQDYILIKQELEKKLTYQSYLAFCKYFEFNYQEHQADMEQIIQLPIIAFSSVFNHISSDEDELITFSFDDKLQILQADYFKECSNLHINPLTDLDKIDALLNELSNLTIQSEMELLTKSLFGKRKMRELKNACRASLPLDFLHLIFYGTEACCISCTTDTHECIFVYVPLMKLFNRKANIDNNILHELRHAVEANSRHIGLCSIDNQQAYSAFNELRTQIHANEDLERVPFIFSRTTTPGTASLYDSLIPLIESFNSNYRYLIDNASFTNCITILSTLFGSSFDELNGSLLNILSRLRQVDNTGLNFDASINGAFFKKLFIKMNDQTDQKKANRMQKKLKRKYQGWTAE